MYFRKTRVEAVNRWSEQSRDWWLAARTLGKNCDYFKNKQLHTQLQQGRVSMEENIADSKKLLR